MTAQILAFAPRRAHLAAHERNAIERMGACLPAPDPFGIANSCENPMGHFFIKDRTRIVCTHCSRIFWEG